MQGMAKKGSILGAVGGALLLSLLALNVGQIANACGVCVISWDPGELSCALANSSKHFSYAQTTKGSSGNNGDANGHWTLYQALAHPSGSNITNVAVTPSSAATHTVTEVGGIAEFSVNTDCAGDLINVADGTSDLNAWDGSCWQCSGSHRVTVHPSTGSCP